MPKGYSGKILRVNLSNRQVSVEPLPDHFNRRYLGGWGLVGYYLLKEVSPGADPLGPANKLIFAPGIFTGVQLSGNGRSAVGAKSPLTGGFGEADAGGFFGSELARAGWDALIVEGKADRPVYISIVDDKVEIRDAAHLWGKDTVELEKALKSELGSTRTRFAGIGRAGENLVVTSCVINDVHHAAGRTGLGAVMGSKKLKAVAARATAKKEVHDDAKIREIAQWLLGEGKPKYQRMQDMGTPGVLDGLQKGGGLPTRNFNLGDFEQAGAINGPTMTSTILTGRGTCDACVVRCKREVEIKEGPFKTSSAYGGPEYETLAALGSNCGIGDLAAISRGNAICNGEGLDTIGAGMMVSFAMECFENGVITEKQTGGLKLNFGNGAAMVKLLEMMVSREGIGDLLAGGYKACIEAWGPKAKQYAHSVKGQPCPMHEPRFKYGLGVGYAVSPTGADHCHNLHDTLFTTDVGLEGVYPFGVLQPLPADDMSPAKMRMLYYQQHFSLLKNHLGMCIFVPYGPNAVVDIVRAVTGWDTSLFELMKASERGMAMARAFNAREGFTAKDDTLPERFFERFESGPQKGKSQDRQQFQSALNTYYQIAGWDPASGAPMAAKLYELDLGWVVDELAKHEVVAKRK